MIEGQIREVFTGIAGSHIRSLNSSGMVAIKEKEVTQADIDRVVETAKAIAIPKLGYPVKLRPPVGLDDVEQNRSPFTRRRTGV